MKQSLSRKLTSVILLTVLIAVGLVSFSSSYFIHDQFKDYIIEKQTQTINQIVAQASLQYNTSTESWDQEKVHEVGMYALYSGYIIKVYDKENNSIWDAEVWDMSACVQLINDITHRMLNQFPAQEGKFISRDYILEYKSSDVGKITISYFGPYFYQVDDLKFINQLQLILLIIAMISILSSVFVGIYFAKTLTKPILKTIDATKSIASGHYDYSIDYHTNITEVSELIDSINYLSKTLNEQDRIKKQITSDVAHELRTPLSTLLLNIEAVRDGLVDLDSNRLKSLYDEVLRLTSIVKDLEQLNKIEVSSQKLDYQMFDIKELLIECINSLNVKLDEKNIDVILKVDSNQIEGDRNRLYQVFYNLILNACLYSNQNSQVFITSEIKDHYITIEVKDNGIGIPEESLPYIFERFYRVDSSRNRDSGGSGIGLTIVKQFVEAHEGRVEVESQLNVGTTFTIILPIKKSS